MKHNQFPRFILGVLLVALLSACATQQSGTAKAELPVEKAYAEGKTIYITHLEASNDKVAQSMAAMVKSPVMYVPSLASVPKDAQANVYLFTNGIKGTDPAGIQVAVFDNPPGTEGYTPLRRMNMVTWTDETKAHELKSVAEILDAAKAGELAIKQTGVVINMPIIVWDGGKR